MKKRARAPAQGNKTDREETNKPEQRNGRDNEDTVLVLSEETNKVSTITT